MVIKLDGNYKGNDYQISKDGLSALIFTRKGIIQKSYPELSKFQYEERLIKIKSRIYYVINKL